MGALGISGALLSKSVAVLSGVVSASAPVSSPPAASEVGYVATSSSALASADLRLGLFALVCVACVVFVRIFAKKRGVKFGGRLSVVESAMVGNGSNVSVVRAVGRYFLVGVGKEHVSLIAELDAEDFTEGDAQPVTVMGYLKRLSPLGKKESRDDEEK